MRQMDKLHCLESQATEIVLQNEVLPADLTQHGGSTIDTYDDAFASKVTRVLGSEIMDTLRTNQSKLQGSAEGL
jgi:hypothetical protein